MANTTSQAVVFNGQRHYVVNIRGTYDGTGNETNAIKVDLSAITLPNGKVPTRMDLEEASWDISGFNFIRLAWDHTTDITIAVLSTSGYKDFSRTGPLIDTGIGDTGDIILTADGGAAGSSYDITLVLRPRY